MERAARKRVFIRTDANRVIASGHVMRCLSVADVLSARGAEVEFVLSDDGPAAIIRGRGYEALVLETDWRQIEEGVARLEERCANLSKTPVVLIDTYSVTASYVDFLSRCSKVCYLGSKGGDLGSLSLLANYSTDIDEEGYEALYGARGTKLLLGPSYAPLRAQFASSFRERSGVIGKVLVTTGNTDPAGFAPAFVRAALASRVLVGVEFVVVVGGMFEGSAELEGIAAESSRVELRHAVTDMASLMATADAAVSANGTTVYEMAAAGLPAVTFAMVREQVESAESLGRLGAVAYAGALEGSVESVVGSAVRLLEELVASPERTCALAKQAHKFVDGLGAGRIAKEILSL